MRTILLMIVLAMASLNASAMGETTDSLVQNNDSLAVAKKPSPLASWWRNLVNGNVDKTFEKKVDLSYAAYPYYSSETSLGLGAYASALFRTNRKDSIMQPSDISLGGGYYLSGTYYLGFQGNVHFTRNKRLKYSAQFLSQHQDFWGIDFMSCYTNPSTVVRKNSVEVRADYVQRFAGNWFWGAALRVMYGNMELDKPEYLQGQNNGGFYSGLGFSLVYDSRDFILNPKQGMYFMFRHIFYPSMTGDNNCDIGYTTIQFNAYHKLWKDAIMAYDLLLETNVSDGELPWQLREKICSDDCRMRGYYPGSYMDNNQTCVQAELRQHIYKRFGAAAWVGMGMLFKDFESLRSRYVLPNYGVGLRFEMKKNTNVRADFGFGRNTFGVIVSMAEAF